MALPFEPEPLSSLRARWAAAVADLWDADAIHQNPNADRPGKHRRHVFDHKPGMRFIVARERSRGLGEYLHVSLSIRRGSYKSVDTAVTQALELLNFMGRGDTDRPADHVDNNLNILHLIWVLAPPSKPRKAEHGQEN